MTTNCEPRFVFEIVDATDEENCEAIGVFQDLGIAIAEVQGWAGAIPQLEGYDYLRVEIRRIPLDQIDANTEIAWECEWEWSEDKDQWEVSAGDDQVSAFDEEVTDRE